MDDKDDESIIVGIVVKKPRKTQKRGQGKLLSSYGDNRFLHMNKSTLDNIKGLLIFILIVLFLPVSVASSIASAKEVSFKVDKQYLCIPLSRNEEGREHEVTLKVNDKNIFIEPMHFEEKGEEFLFDLSVDIGEQNNLKNERPEKFKEMRESWIAWRKEMDETEPRGPFRNY